MQHRFRVLSALFRRRGLSHGALFGLLGLALLLFAPRPAPAQSTEDRLPDLREAIRDRVDEQKTHAGIVVGVVDAQGRRTFGYGRTRDGGARVDASTVFEIGSLTKVVTGLLLAHAVEQGTLALDAPAEGALPVTVNLPARNGTEVTFRHLVTHTSGLPRLPVNLDVYANPSDPYASYTIQDLYRALDQLELDEAPGTEYTYSNLGYGLLGHALARSRDTTYSALVETCVGEPLGMETLRMEGDSSAAERVATGHDAAGRAVSDWTFTEAFAGAGALHASVHDMLTFLEAQLDLRDVPDRLAAAIERSHTVLRDEEDETVAYGWHVRAVDGRQTFWHNGRTGGFASFMAFDPKREIGVVVLANSAQSVTDIGRRLLGRKADLESAYNQHRRFAVEGGVGRFAHGEPTVRLRASWGYALDRRGNFRVRPFVEYARFRRRGDLGGPPTPSRLAFNFGTAGALLEYKGLFSSLFRVFGLPGELDAGLGVRANYAFRIGGRDPARDELEGASRWSYQFLGSRLSYQKGPISVTYEKWGRLRAFGDSPVARPSGGPSATISLGYTF